MQWGSQRCRGALSPTGCGIGAVWEGLGLRGKEVGWGLWGQTSFLRPGGVGAREAAAPAVPSTRPSDGGNGGLTHRGALSASGSFRTSHTSRTLGRKEGDGEARSPRGRAVGFWARVPSEPRGLLRARFSEMQLCQH